MDQIVDSDSILRFKVLYTHQKAKKAKTWQDGFLHYKIVNRKATLFSEDDKNLDSVFVRINEVCEDATLESDKYLIQVETRVNSYSSKDENSAKENIVNQNTSTKNEIKKSVYKPYFRAPSVIKKSNFERTENASFKAIESCYKEKTAKEVISDNRIPKTLVSTGPIVKENVRPDLKKDIRPDNIMETFNGLENRIMISPGETRYSESKEINDCYSNTTVPQEHSGSKRTVKDMLSLFADDDYEDVFGSKSLMHLGNEPGKSSKNIIWNPKHTRQSKISVDIFSGEIPDSDNAFLYEIPQSNDKFPGDSSGINDALDDQSHRDGTKKIKLSRDFCMDNAQDQHSSRTSGTSNNVQDSLPSKRTRYESECFATFRNPLSSNGSERILSTKARHYQNGTSIASLKSLASFRAPLIPKPTNASYRFPSKEECQQQPQIPGRVTRIPFSFNSVADYKRTLKMALIEHLNILLHDISVRYHRALNNVDYSGIENTMGITSEKSANTIGGPECKHKQQAVLRTVRKEGKNKGCLFYSCAENGDRRCDFFEWADNYNKKTSANQNNSSKNNNREGRRKTVVQDTRSLSSFLNSHNIQLYCGVKIARKTFGFNFQRKRQEKDATPKKKLFIVLPEKKSASFYSKDDIWIVSKSLNFPQTGSTTFIAQSVFYGPNSSGELEISPLASYSMSNWPNGELCYAIHAFNATTELTCIENLDNYVNTIDVPIMRTLLDNVKHGESQYGCFSLFCLPDISNRVKSYVERFSLNVDQEKALHNIAELFVSGKSDKVTLIHGVFGAGKSFLLSVVVLFLLEVFEIIETRFKPDYKLKLMIASATNVAVDRVLSCLMDRGYEEFLRVGSLKKIAKPILPFSLHADEHEDQEKKELNEILRSDLSEVEKEYVKKAIELHKKGVNRKRLDDVRVVGVTCASCVFPLLQKRTFQVHLLDECSQMVEQLSMLPLARFRCQRLVLVGDPNQLSPTIQGSESEHTEGLEMTMFERLEKMGYRKVTLRYQYRCHPAISSICSKMFYEGKLQNGVTTEERPRLLEWLPHLSIINISQGEEKCGPDGSYYNEKEAEFIVKTLTDILETGIEPIQIGVITQYKTQVLKIRTLLYDHNAKFTATELKGIQISTVDAFQGAEKDIILLSCVRTRFVGFINCPRRTNVALSRAKHHLVIAGNLRLLRSDKLWSRVLDVAEEQNAYFGRGLECLNFSC